MKNSLELIELSSIKKISLVLVSSCSDTGSIRDDPYWISRKNSLESIELSSTNKVSLVQIYNVLLDATNITSSICIIFQLQPRSQKPSQVQV